MKKVIVNVLFSALILTILSTAVIGEDPDREPEDKAPDFSLMSVTGDSISLSDFAGKVVILHFWKSN